MDRLLATHPAPPISLIQPVSMIELQAITHSKLNFKATDTHHKKLSSERCGTPSDPSKARRGPIHIRGSPPQPNGYKVRLRIFWTLVQEIPMWLSTWGYNTGHLGSIPLSVDNPLLLWVSIYDCMEYVTVLVGSANYYGPCDSTLGSVLKDKRDEA